MNIGSVEAGVRGSLEARRTPVESCRDCGQQIMAIVEACLQGVKLDPDAI